ncbi:hypothetical protein [Rhodopseudomonas palustris]|nr:hypothetical protein [Rhodopseudomonas palustris]
MFRYVCRRDDEPVLHERLRFGCRRLHNLLACEVVIVRHKKL